MKAKELTQAMRKRYASCKKDCPSTVMAEYKEAYLERYYIAPDYDPLAFTHVYDKFAEEWLEKAFLDDQCMCQWGMRDWED